MLWHYHLHPNPIPNPQTLMSFGTSQQKRNPHLLEFHRDNVDCGGGDFCSEFSAAKRRRQYPRRSRLPHTPYLFVRRTPVSQVRLWSMFDAIPDLALSSVTPVKSQTAPSPTTRRPRPPPLTRAAAQRAPAPPRVDSTTDYRNNLYNQHKSMYEMGVGRRIGRHIHTYIHTLRSRMPPPRANDRR